MIEKYSLVYSWFLKLVKHKDIIVHDRNDIEFLKVHTKDLASNNDARSEKGMR